MLAVSVGVSFAACLAGGFVGGGLPGLGGFALRLLLLQLLLLPPLLLFLGLGLVLALLLLLGT